MTVRPLRLLENNDEVLNVAITVAGVPHNLTGAEVEMVIKTSVDLPEGTYADASVIVLSTETGEIEVTDAEEGQVTIDVNAADLAIPGDRVYRIDVLDETGRRTAIHGDLTVIDL